MLVKEYRITLPMSLEEYQRGQVYSVAESARRETGGGDGIEVLVNEPFEDLTIGNGQHMPEGQYTLKKYHIDHKVPGYVRVLCPKGSLDLKEECWNAFPYFRTIITNDYLGERLHVLVESIHLADRGGTENALNLPPEKLKLREVINIDIAEELEPHEEAQLAEDENPRRFRSTKTLRGPLNGNWIRECKPVMTCYKVVTCEFRVFGLQSRLEHFVQKNEQRIFTALHRRMFCWIDKWIDLTIEDARSYEETVNKELDQQRETGVIRGLRAID